jgi:bifunctional non-homologous end joining protein LigD
MHGRLEEYHNKRDFRATPEPHTRGGRARQEAPIFVIQLHHARRRHFDFRLQVGGSLRSWAVPKGPSRDPREKRLAVEVEDHPLDYAGFEGDIPQGHYGAGHVDIWDQGIWTPASDPYEALKKGHLDFELHGERLRGHWTLVRTCPKGRQPQWLLFKRSDEEARSGDLADDMPLSQWREARPGRKSAHKTGPARRSARLPDDVGLQLARVARHAPDGREWLHEIKYDGYRVLLFRDGKKVRIASRSDLDWTRQLPQVRKAVLELPCRQAILDGELVALDARGQSRFDLLQERFGHGGELRVLVFDLLYLDGEDLRQQPLEARRAWLDQLLQDRHEPLYLCNGIAGDGPAVARAACAAGLEGIVSKLRSAPYSAGRSGHWLKIKCIQSDEFVVIGYTRGRGARERLGSLLLARPPGSRGEDWRYVGRAGSGLGESAIDQLLKRLKPARQPVRLAEPPGRAELRGATPIWVKPDQVVEVEFRAWTDGGILRQAAIKGLRPDKSPRELACADAPPAVHAKRAVRGGAAQRSAREDTRASSVVLTHPQRRLFEDPPITKAQIAQLYSDIAGLILPGVVRRPLSLVRCPNGIKETCFFQKHLSRGSPASIRSIPLKSGEPPYVYIEDLEGLIGLVQMNVVEIHPWGARIDDVEHPDRLVFDLDPAPGLPWPRVIEAAREVRERLAGLHLESFLRASGGKGLHVIVPLTGGDDWNGARAFCRALAATMAHESPEKYVDVANKARREGRIFIDYLRNARGATSVASYSLRARPGAPIAVPLPWSALPRLRSAAPYRFSTIRRNLKRVAGAWDGIDQVRQALPRG